MRRDIDDLAGDLWNAVGDPDGRGPLEVTGDRDVLASVYDVTGLAAASVAAANLALAELIAARSGGAAPPVRVDTRGASAAFVGELLFAPHGWQRPAIFDPVAGDYRAGDGWIRLHTNYAGHRTAALTVLGLPDVATTDRDAVASVVARWAKADLEQAVVDSGGAAAAMHDAATWRTHPHGSVTVDEPPARVVAGDEAPVPRWAAGAPPQPLTGVNVLDLTRVIAGPVCTRFLAAHGANVLRLDPPGFGEVAAVVPVVTPGKRCAALDLASAAGRQRVVELVADADVIVHGLRPGAMERLGLAPTELRTINPGLVDARLDAYGWVGPWAARRGFDSLVQMSCGIAAAGGAASGVDGPVPLPAQALDHATGYLLAAAVGRALTRRLLTGRPTGVTASLLGVANVLRSLPVPDGLLAARPVWDEGDLVDVSTAWGPARAVPTAGEIVGHPAGTSIEAGPLGRHDATW